MSDSRGAACRLRKTRKTVFPRLTRYSCGTHAVSGMNPELMRYSCGIRYEPGIIAALTRNLHGTECFLSVRGDPAPAGRAAARGARARGAQARRPFRRLGKVRAGKRPGRDTTERDFEGLGAGGARVGARRAGVRRPRTDAGGCGGPTPAAGFAARGLARVRGGPGRPPRGLGVAGERQRRTRCATRGRAPHGPGHTHTARVTSLLAWTDVDGPSESIMDPSES